MNQVSELWTAIFKEIEYKIVYIDKKASGNGSYLDVRAIPLFYDQFRVSVVHYLYNGSMTATDCFTRIFSDTDFNFVLVDPSYAVEWEGFGKGQSRMELFKRALDRYGYEFYVEGSTVYLKSLIGNDTNFLYKYRLNASNVTQSRDATAMFTHIKGFGKFDDGEEDYLNNAQLQREYTSPLSTLLGIREAPPIVDRRVSVASALDEMMRRKVDDSLQISVDATLHDIRQMGYEEAVPLKGDRVFLMDERIGLDQEIRVQVVETTYNARGEVIRCNVTFGSQNIRQRYKANLQTISNNMRDLMAGKIQLPFDVLDSRAKDMVKKIQDASSEIVFDENGIHAISTTNPNYMMSLTSEGWLISTDGGATASTIATADGFIADAITAGTIWLQNDMTILGLDGWLEMSGDTFKMTNATTPDKYFEISPQGAHAHKGMFKLTRPDYYVDTNGKEYGLLINDGTPQWSFSGQMVGPNLMASGVSVSGQFYSTYNTDDSAMETWYFIHNTRYVNLRGYAHMYYPDGQDASGVVKIKGFGNLTNDQGQPLEAQQFIPIGPVNADSQTEQVFINITLDMGVPDNSLKSFYIQGRTGNASSAIRFRRLILNWYG